MIVDPNKSLKDIILDTFAGHIEYKINSIVQNKFISSYPNCRAKSLVFTYYISTYEQFADMYSCNIDGVYIDRAPKEFYDRYIELYYQEIGNFFQTVFLAGYLTNTGVQNDR